MTKVVVGVRDTGGTPEHPIFVGSTLVTTGINQYDAKHKVQIIRAALRAAGIEQLTVSWPEGRFFNWPDEDKT